MNKLKLSVQIYKKKEKPTREKSFFFSYLDKILFNND